MASFFVFVSRPSCTLSHVFRLFCALLGLAGSVISAASPSAAASRASIIYLLIDDLGPDWLGCYGSDFSTPNVDRLARMGTRFKTAWTSPICTPSRVMMLTGQYPGRTGWTEHYDVPRWGGDGLIPEKFSTWPQLLRRAGYATALAGKWQINDLRQRADILSAHGFERHCVWPGVEEGNPPSVRRYWDAFLQTDGVRRVHTEEYGPDVTQRFALDFIRANQSKPFLLYYAMISVHAPNEPTPLNRAHPPRGEAALYAGSVTYMDHQVGELLDELERLGLADNTVVVLMGDNGSSTGGTVHGQAVKPGKGKTWERGVHVPLIVHLPGVAGGVTPALADMTDLFPTMLELAGIPRPSGLDGHSWVPLLRKAADAPRRTWIFAQRDDARTVRDQRFKLDSDGRFYDIENDPDQSRARDPNETKETAAAYRQLSAALQAVPRTAASPPFSGYSPERMRSFERQKKQ